MAYLARRPGLSMLPWYVLFCFFSILSRCGQVWVDNPVGTGFSYTTSPSSFATTDEEIAEGLVRFATGFFTNYPKLSNNDFWIFTESYGE